MTALFTPTPARTHDARIPPYARYGIEYDRTGVAATVVLRTWRKDGTESPIRHSPTRRLQKEALCTVPSLREWAACVALQAAFCAVALPLCARGGVFDAIHPDDLSAVRKIGFALLFVALPALSEELLFRVVLTPRRGWALASVYVSALFAAVHVVSAVWRSRGRGWEGLTSHVFCNPAFLGTCFLMGVTNTAAMHLVARRSVWPAVFTHWSVVVVWQLFMGGYQRIVRD
jgi:predicted Abi (CAAX) family protease